MKTERRIPIVLAAVGLALVLLVPAVSAHAQAAPTVLNDVTVSTQPDSVTVYVKTSREPKYRAELIAAPSRLVVDLENTVYAWRKTPLALGGDPLRQIRGSQYRKGVARVVFELTRNVGYAIREENDGLAIVIPTAQLGAVAAAPAKAAAASTKPAAPAVRPAPVRVAQAVPAAPPATPPPSGLISFDFKDADVVNLLRILAAESTKNIVIGDDIKGKMSITLRNVPWDLAFNTVLETRGLQKVEKDGVIRIVSNDQLVKEREARLRVEESKLKADNDIRTKAAEAKMKEQEANDKERVADAARAEAQARGPLREETIRLAYGDPVDVASTLQGVLGMKGSGGKSCQEYKPGASGTTAETPGGPPPIPAPPFSALYGTGPQQAPAPPAPPAPPEVLAKGITIQAHCPTNSVFIRHYAADLERLKKLIKEKLDIALPQVKIEARMNELNRTEFFGLGVSWGGAAARRSGRDVLIGQGFAGHVPPTKLAGGPDNTSVGLPAPGATDAGTNPGLTLGQLLPISGLNGLPLGGNLVNLPISGAGFGTPAGIAFGIVSGMMNLNLVLDALEAENKTVSLAKPEIVTVENAKATISLGSEIPYATVSSAGTQVQFREALLRLEVTPTVIREADVTRVKMVVSVENNSRGVDVNTASGPVPSINKRTATTQVVVKEGETLAIGGIRQRESQGNVTKIPFFGDIPVLGFFFRSTQRTTDPNRELVVFITPHVLTTDVAQAPKK